ncbi:MAG: aminotransferase class V-fold PLP-dependent enzyme, partial [Massilia sp.]|nr:aminotransferase class V-fold PLP-dependent enzyme [Massilia sp.]
MLNPFDFDALRAREFSRLDAQSLAYLDYAAAALYGQSQVDAYAERLARTVYGNPHSAHAPSQASTDDVALAKAATLAFFDADPALYEVCLTANTSAALKLVAESYPFDAGRPLVFSADNHNSVTGAREFARAKGAPIVTLPLDGDLRLDRPDLRIAAAAGTHGAGLLAFPAQSNFSGVKHDLELIGTAQALGYDVLLDAAAAGVAGGLSLREHPVEFLALAFYKLFGLPSGMGALVVKRSALARSKRPWFAGAAERAFGLAGQGAGACLDRLGAQFSIAAFQACLGAGTPVGALRLSLGLPSNAADVD